MAIERLSFSSDNQYSAIELAIHLARYSVAQNLCKGLKVLDVACGEGYGSYAMASFWGARSVTGVDISEEAINIAKNTFIHPKVEYKSSPAENIDKLFKKNSFDLVISLETIEHVNDPEQFILAIKKVLKPNGIVILSCPNDHWYYGPGESQNPFHLRTYYFNEFKEQAENLLGEARCFLFGWPLNGFGNFLLDEETNEVSAKKFTEELDNTKVVDVNQIATDQSISTEDCSYFIGVWGNLPVTPQKIVSSTLYPISMDKFSLTLEDLNNSLKDQLNILNPRLENLENENDGLQLQVQNSQSRIIELEKWTTELQTLFKNSQSRIAELEKWTTELQTALTDSEKAVETLQSDLLHTNEQKNLAQLTVETLQSESETLQRELNNIKNIIREMEASNLWKFRNHWSKLKTTLAENKKGE